MRDSSRSSFIFLILVCILTTHIQAQELDGFKPLIGKVWKADGKWGDGSKFKQEIEFSFDLNNSIIIANPKALSIKKANRIWSS